MPAQIAAEFGIERRSYLYDSVHGLWTVAKLTLTEAIRRRFWIAALFVCGLYVGLAFLPFHMDPQRQEMLGPMEHELVKDLMATYGAGMIDFFCFLFAVALSAGVISAEIERGAMAVIVPKPLPRWSIYVGKLLGVNLFLASLLVLLTCLLQWAIWMHVHSTCATLWRSMAIMYLYPLVFSSLTVCFSSFTGTLLSTILPLMLAAAAWSEGILRDIGYGLDVNSLKIASHVVVYIVPLNPMSRWLEKSLDLDLTRRMFQAGQHPWPNDPPAGAIDLIWILGYALIALAVGLLVFERRDL